jgi:8-oxo-dGTP pyrophosphatase MutT (NUDIX family)
MLRRKMGGDHVSGGSAPWVPRDLPVTERDVVRLLVMDREERLLLLHTHDPTYPELGHWWELPGGGIEDGESLARAATRELLEETGIGIDESQVETPRWRRTATFKYRGERRVNHERVALVRLSISAPRVDGTLRVGFEDEDYVGHRWWPVTEIVASDERFYPGRLAQHLPAVLSGILRG